MSRPYELPDGLIAYGPDTNCTLEICPVEWSVVGYRPSVSANGAFIAFFSLSLLFHLYQGLKLRTWGYMACMALGCIDEIFGYAGRIWLHQNPFSFEAFLIEIICITTGPVFFCAAIYVTLSRTIRYLDPALSRFNPRMLYYVFIPFDIISLALQAAGGGSSSTATGSNQAGVDVSLVGLGLQVLTLVAFIAVSLDYLVRYLRQPTRPRMELSMKVFLGSLGFAIMLILIRCAYRIDELSEGYDSDTFRDENLFIGLEGVIMLIAVYLLNVSQPAYALGEAALGGHVTPQHDSGRGKETWTGTPNSEIV